MSRRANRMVLWIRASGAHSLLVPLALSAGCGIFGHGGKKGVEGDGKEMRLTFTGIERLNSCGEDAGNALSIRILQLTSDGALTGLALTQLWDHEKDELGDELIEQQEVVLDPGTEVTVPIERRPNARFLAVAASFCKPEGNCWRWIRSTQNLKDSVKLTFDESCIREARAAKR